MPAEIPTVEVLLFDLGGVIIDIDFQRAFGAWARAAGVPPEQIAAGFIADASYQAHERGEISGTEYFNSLRRSLGLSLTHAQMEEGWNAILVAEKREFTDLIRALPAHLPRYIFSNSNDTHKNHWMAQQHLADSLTPFRRVFVSSDIGMRKPEARAFHHVAREIGVAPQNILFFDDLLENVEGARAAGLQAVHVPTVTELRTALASFGGS